MIEIPEILEKLQGYGNIEIREMYRTFNMGIGFIIIVAEEDENSTLKLLNEFYPSFTIGEIREGNQVNLAHENIIYSG